MRDAKRILLWHGYLLSGSGSNIATANLARAWRAAGHDVLLLCQERRAAEFAWVDAAGVFSPDNSQWRAAPTAAPPAPGRCTVACPHIGDVLPVYVLDEYEGFTAKRFVDLDDYELERYVNANVLALTSAIRAHRPHAIVVGHEVMGPAIARDACERTGTDYVAKLHGSALEYAVKVQERYRRFAWDGLSAAKAVTGGSRYMLDAAAATIGRWPGRAVVVPPGCDAELFRPLEGRPRGALAGYVGKLIAAKGVQHLLAALGLTRVPGLRLEVVGFGALSARLEELAGALAGGDLARARALAVIGEDGRPLGALARFLVSPRADATYLRRARDVDVRFLGRLDHEALAPVMPRWDVLVAPSIVAEAFGMVAAEAAACGVPPVVPRHSGIGEVGAALEDALGAPGLLTFDPAEPVTGIGAALDRVLSLPASERAEMSAALAAFARARWSWATVAEQLLQVALAEA